LPIKAFRAFGLLVVSVIAIIAYLIPVGLIAPGSVSGWPGACCLPVPKGRHNLAAELPKVSHAPGYRFQFPAFILRPAHRPPLAIITPLPDY
jgi:hypothetical protein